MSIQKERIIGPFIVRWAEGDKVINVTYSRGKKSYTFKMDLDKIHKLEDIRYVVTSGDRNIPYVQLNDYSRGRFSIVAYLHYKGHVKQGMGKLFRSTVLGDKNDFTATNCKIIKLQ